MAKHYGANIQFVINLMDVVMLSWNVILETGRACCV